MLDKLRSIAPDSVRGALHAVAGPLVVALVAWGMTNEVQAAAIVGAIVAVIELAVATIHAENTARALIYPAIAAVAAVPIVYGVLNEEAVAAALGVIAAVLGSGVAARYTPESSKHATVAAHRA